MKQAQLKMKLIMASLSLAMAVVLLVTGTMAWYIVSSTPEIHALTVKMEYDGTQWPFEVSFDHIVNGEINPDATWDKELAIDPFMVDGLLRPISTANLINWFLPTYDAFGNVDGYRKVDISEISNHRNVHAEEETQEEGNYLIYFDMWVRGEEEGKTFALRLNNPDVNDDGTLRLNEDEQSFGTYILWAPLTQTENYIAKGSDNDAMTALRIGFMVFDDASPSEGVPSEFNNKIENIFIYEPNADNHKGLGTMSQVASYSQTQYLYTGTVGSHKVGEYAAVEGQIYGTDVPTVKAYPFGIVAQPSMSGVTGADLVAPRDPVLHYDSIQGETCHPVMIRQRKSTWNMEKLQAKLDAGEPVDSTCLAGIGRFVSWNGSGSGTEISPGDLPVMATISKDHIRRIRVFIWLEGQDVDCWNQTSGCSIYGNLEFRGDPVTPSNVSPEP